MDLKIFSSLHRCLVCFAAGGKTIIILFWLKRIRLRHYSDLLGPLLQKDLIPYFFNLLASFAEFLMQRLKIPGNIGSTWKKSTAKSIIPRIYGKPKRESSGIVARSPIPSARMPRSIRQRQIGMETLLLIHTVKFITKSSKISLPLPQIRKEHSRTVV